MSSNTDEPTGIPTRAIHEAYLEMQRALRTYRQAEDNGNQTRKDHAHADLQQAVLTVYEMLRPHIKGNNAVNEYWDGKPPSYNYDGTPPDPQDGAGIIQTQRRRDSINLSEALDDTDPENLETLQGWHDSLDLNGDIRLTAVQTNGETALIHYDAYEMGLRRLDDWQTDFQQVQTQLDGFLKGKTTTKTQRSRVAVHRLKQAARELSDVARKLGALSTFKESVPRTEISKELIQEVEEWRQQNIK